MELNILVPVRVTDTQNHHRLFMVFHTLWICEVRVQLIRCRSVRVQLPNASGTLVWNQTIEASVKHPADRRLRLYCSVGSFLCSLVSWYCSPVVLLIQWI